MSESILDAEEACLSFNNELRQIGWERFDKVHDSIEALTREADFFVDILSDKKQYDDNGKLTDAGLATMGMHGTNYNIYMEQALNYTRELEAVEREIAENPHDEALQKRKKELKAAAGHGAGGAGRKKGHRGHGEGRRGTGTGRAAGTD